MKIPLLAKNAKEPAKTPPGVADDDLPTGYMSDYSVMGVVVDAVEECVQVLEANAFAVIKDALSVEILVAGSREVGRLMTLLEEHGLQCQMADVAEEIYQG